MAKPSQAKPGQLLEMPTDSVRSPVEEEEEEGTGSIYHFSGRGAGPGFTLDLFSSGLNWPGLRKVCASFNHPGTIIPALNYRHQIYGLINVNNLVLSRFTARNFRAINYWWWGSRPGSAIPSLAEDALR